MFWPFKLKVISCITSTILKPMKDFNNMTLFSIQHYISIPCVFWHWKMLRIVVKCYGNGITRLCLELDYVHFYMFFFSSGHIHEVMEISSSLCQQSKQLKTSQHFSSYSMVVTLVQNIYISIKLGFEYPNKTFVNTKMWFLWDK